MATEPKASLRVQALAKRLATHPNGARLSEYASTLDGWIHEWARYASRKDLREDERMRALGMLASMRRDFNALLAEADAHEPSLRGRPTHFGTALDELGEAEKMALSQILGLPFAPQYRPLFEVKAAEYIEQDELWNAITEEGGFVSSASMAEDAVQSAVVLTYSGSLLLVSAPTERKNFRRRYVYQSIYAGHLPSEGNIGLLEPIRPNLPVSGTRIKTSPVRKLRVSRDGHPTWDQHRETFLKLHRTMNGAATPHSMMVPPPEPSAPGSVPQPVLLGAAAPRASSPGSASKPASVSGSGQAAELRKTAGDGTPLEAAGTRPDVPKASERPPSARKKSSTSGDRIPSVFVQVLHSERQRESVKKMEDAARAELRTLLARLIETVGDRDHALEAEIIGQVLYLQRLGVERGELAVMPQDLVRLDTENNDLCTATNGGLALGKLGQRSNTIVGAHLGAQTIVRGAPLAILAKDSNLYAVLGNVRSYVKKG